MKETVGLKTATVLFARKVSVLKLLLHWPGGRGGQNATDVFSLYSEFFHLQVTVDT